jgi:hypothetical protein
MPSRTQFLRIKLLFKERCAQTVRHILGLFMMMDQVLSIRGFKLIAQLLTLLQSHGSKYLNLLKNSGQT